MHSETPRTEARARVNRPNKRSPYQALPGISRKEAMQRLQLSLNGIKSTETRGLLRSRKDATGHVFYDPAEVDALAAKKQIPLQSPSEESLALRAFDLFEQNKTMAECVRVLGVAPQVVRRLYLEWVTPLGEAVNPKASRDTLERERLLEHERAMKAYDEQELQMARERERRKRFRLKRMGF